MALLWVTGAEWNDIREVDTLGAPPSVSAVTPKSGSYVYLIQGNGSGIRRGLAVTKTELYMKIDINITVLVNDITIMEFRKSSTSVVALRLDTSELRLFLTINGVAQPNGSIFISEGVYTTIELHALIDVAGVAEFRVNGVDDATGTFTGDTTPGGANVDEVRIIMDTTNSVFRVDNITLHDVSGAVNNSWPDDVEWTLLRGNAIGNSSQFTPDPVADNFLNVNNDPPDAAKIVESTTNGFIDMYELDNVPAEARGIVGVVVQAFATREATGLQNLQLGIRPVSTNFFSPNILLPTVSDLREHIFEDNPETSLPFTAAEVDAMELGMKSVT